MATARRRSRHPHACNRRDVRTSARGTSDAQSGTRVVTRTGDRQGWQVYDAKYNEKHDVGVPILSHGLRSNGHRYEHHHGQISRKVHQRMDLSARSCGLHTTRRGRPGHSKFLVKVQSRRHSSQESRMAGRQVGWGNRSRGGKC